jgi:NAD(P)-dependent dehydrogenase (short-subunit alcohol dehydrogenase family)
MTDSGRSFALEHLFSLEGRIAVVTGGTGVLGGVVARGLHQAGAQVVVIGRSRAKVDAINAASEPGLSAIEADVRDSASVESARDIVLERFGEIDILVNMAGGNIPAATATADRGFFGLEDEAVREVLDLNLMGTVIPTRIFGEVLVKSTRGASIVNISSVAAAKPLTRVVGYAAAKSAIENFTKWAAADLARTHGYTVRVNAIAPGFYIGEQNRALLLEPDGSLTERGRLVIDHTPAGRFGNPEELIGAIVWLCGPGASFVTGTVIPIDGGFTAFAGV